MYKKIKTHDFKINGGESNIPGEFRWPDCLNIEISQYKALQLISQLALSLKAQTHSEETITLSFMGKLVYHILE